HGPPGRVLDGVVAGSLGLLCDDRILAEYHDVLARPRLKIDPEERDRLLDYLDRVAERVTAPPLAVALPDPDDLPFLEVAVAACADALVTGNLRDFPPEARHGARVEAPATFVARWAASLQTPT
ncbi:MAG: PIN domain-containing protein, partial [Deltaproteobacteria bacterium]|nr:PIN domain-containing protein [Deltaproteobacteria bacterium]